MSSLIASIMGSNILPLCVYVRRRMLTVCVIFAEGARKVEMQADVDEALAELNRQMKELNGEVEN